MVVSHLTHRTKSPFVTWVNMLIHTQTHITGDGPRTHWHDHNPASRNINHPEWETDCVYIRLRVRLLGRWPFPVRQTTGSTAWATAFHPPTPSVPSFDCDRGCRLHSIIQYVNQSPVSIGHHSARSIGDTRMHTHTHSLFFKYSISRLTLRFPVSNDNWVDKGGGGGVFQNISAKVMAVVTHTHTRTHALSLSLSLSLALALVLSLSPAGRRLSHLHTSSKESE